MPYTVDFGISECPVSYIGDEVPGLVSDFVRVKTIHEAYGAPVFTEPYTEWPGKVTELLEILEYERIAEHNARVEAEMREVRDAGRH